MNKEIELKAWVDDTQYVKKNIEKICSKGNWFQKKDEYYKYRILENGKEELQNIRLRIEKDVYIVTIKNKLIENKIEVNDEIEFQVSDSKEFKKFLKLTGARKYLEKSKSGWKYFFWEAEKKFLIELSEVENIGSFVEIEIVLENPNSNEIELAKKQLKNILYKIKVPEHKIECQYYSELLSNRKRKDING